MLVSFLPFPTVHEVLKARILKWFVIPFSSGPHSVRMNSMKRQKDRLLKDELPRSVGAQYATGDQWRNSSRKKEETELKQKQHPIVDVTGDRSPV